MPNLIKPTQRQITDAMLDITKPEHGVDIQIDRKKKTLWVNVDGVCALRICQAPVIQEAEAKPKLIPLTPNQMILLLQIYRQIEFGDAKTQWHLLTEETYRQDMGYLFRHKLIRFDGTLSMAADGIVRVMEVLGNDD